MLRQLDEAGEKRGDAGTWSASDKRQQAAEGQSGAGWLNSGVACQEMPCLRRGWSKVHLVRVKSHMVPTTCMRIEPFLDPHTTTRLCVPHKNSTTNRRVVLTRSPKTFCVPKEIAAKNHNNKNEPIRLSTTTNRPIALKAHPVHHKTDQHRQASCVRGRGQLTTATVPPQEIHLPYFPYLRNTFSPSSSPISTVGRSLFLCHETKAGCPTNKLHMSGARRSVGAERRRAGGTKQIKKTTRSAHVRSRNERLLPTSAPTCHQRAPQEKKSPTSPNFCRCWWYR